MIINLRKIFSIITILGLSIFLGFAFYFVFFQSGINSGLEQVTANVIALYDQQQINSFDFPVRFKIPKIKVDVAVEYVGIMQNGAMGVPKGPINVAWFKDGVRPGNIGSAVIDGHSGWKNGIPSVFDNLYKLKKGDKIYVEDKNGTTITFIVRKIKIYDPKANAADLFNSTDGKSHLNLVTCAGTWNAKDKTHSERLVVFADREI
jgi:LPXTG-site transpeptidase (sortase) family protein